MGNRYFEFKQKGLCIRCGAPRENGKTRCAEHHREHLAYNHQFKEKAIAAGLCRYCAIAPKVAGKSMCAGCLVKHGTKEKAKYAEDRASCIQAYGGSCSCCGNPVQKYLQLDHINNDGAEHRAKLFNSRKGNIYKWAVRNNFPPILQLLCACCHQAKTTHGGCSPEDHRFFVSSE